ncbi:hypothetical protein C2E23DRAFT_159735 [Lenzites betulinus]|nr:hypothetical protein C2E23DRAFT_159735 [Lenzites betulinus]
MLSFQDRFLRAEDEFCQALVNGGNALMTFEVRWEKLLEEVDMAYASSSLDSETAALAHTVSMRLATLADASVELYSSYNAFTSELVADLDTLMSELTLSECPSPPTSVSWMQPSDHHLPPCRSTSRKRCRSDSPPPPPPSKRTCISDYSSATGTRSDAISEASPHRSPIMTSVPPSSPLVPPKQCRKRRLSDADSDASFRPSKRLYAGPRLHAVSDSFPVLQATYLKTDTLPLSTWSSPRSAANSDSSSPPSAPALASTNAISLPAHDTTLDDVFDFFTFPLSSSSESLSQEMSGLDAILSSLLEQHDTTYAEASTFPPSEDRTFSPSLNQASSPGLSDDYGSPSSSSTPIFISTPPPGAETYLTTPEHDFPDIFDHSLFGLDDDSSCLARRLFDLPAPCTPAARSTSPTSSILEDIPSITFDLDWKTFPSYVGHDSPSPLTRCSPLGPEAPHPSVINASTLPVRSPHHDDL